MTPIGFHKRSEWMKNGYSHSHMRSLSCVDCCNGGVVHKLCCKTAKGCLEEIKGTHGAYEVLTPGSNTHTLYNISSMPSVNVNSEAPGLLSVLCFQGLEQRPT